MMRTLLIAVLCGMAMAAMGAGPRPMEGHPGNVFLSDEEVRLPAGDGAWEVVGFDGKPVRKVEAGGGRVDLGRMEVGYYELRREGAKAIAIGVVAPLLAETPATSPIRVDTAASWFYTGDREKQKPAIASLCRLAGIAQVRDRMAWGHIEPTRGEYAAETQYDRTARIFSEAGLRILQVNHSSPGWANPDGKRFPPDLRDTWRFHRHLAERWKGKVESFEPWNEADIDVFGGHTGAEMASFQKAAYWGLRAGNPKAIACLNVLAHSGAATIADLEANDTAAYFDTCNLHHYIALDQYPGWYARFRAISAGRPLWVTEFSRPVQWADEGTKEVSEADLRTQARRVPSSFAASLHEGTAAGFYFILGDYVEGKTQFGIIRRDLTPRPAYLALAAAGRLLADAQAAGRLKSQGPVRGYMFRARPDGTGAEVLVAWAEGGDGELKMPAGATAAYDLFGRKMELGQSVRVGADPVYVVMKEGSAPAMGLEAPPARPERKALAASPIVLQAIWPKDRVDLKKSAYRVKAGEAVKVPVWAYNFGQKEAAVALAATGPEGWTVAADREVKVAPGARVEVAMTLTAGKGEGAVALRGEGTVLSVKFAGE